MFEQSRAAPPNPAGIVFTTQRCAVWMGTHRKWDRYRCRTSFHFRSCSHWQVHSECNGQFAISANNAVAAEHAVSLFLFSKNVYGKDLWAALYLPAYVSTIFFHCMVPKHTATNTAMGNKAFCLSMRVRMQFTHICCKWDIINDRFVSDVLIDWYNKHMKQILNR